MHGTAAHTEPSSAPPGQVCIRDDHHGFRFARLSENCPSPVATFRGPAGASLTAPRPSRPTRNAWMFYFLPSFPRSPWECPPRRSASPVFAGN
jgi:hypothetical protein